jgi:oligogalacturonide transporter
MSREQTKGGWIYQSKPITIGRGIGYGMIDLMGGGWNSIVSGVIFTFLMMQGVSPSLAGATTGVGRLVDAVFTLFIGGITDNFYKTKLGQRFGRRHFFIISGAVLFACVFPMFWISTSNPLFYLFVYIAIELIIAFILIPWETLPTEMTDDYKLRTVLSGSRMFISATGTSMVFIILAILKNANNPDAYLLAGVIWTVVFVVAMVISWRTTWERALTAEFVDELEAQPKQSIGQAAIQNVKGYFSTFRNKSFRKHLSVYLFSFTGKDFYATMIPTFIVYCMLLQEGDSWTLLALSAVGIPATLVAAKLMISKGPRFLFDLCYSLIVVAMLGYALIYLIHPSNPLFWLIGISIVYQIGRAILEFTPWNVFPFIPDVDYIMTREHRAGIYAAVMTFFRKSTGALATWAAGILLEAINFQAAPKNICSLEPTVRSQLYKTDADCLAAGGQWVKVNAEQVLDWAAGTPHSIQLGIVGIFFLGPVTLIVIALVIAQSFRLNKETHSVLAQEIHRLEAGGSKKDVTPQTRYVVEKLTGHKYENIWTEVDFHAKVKNGV